MCECAIDTILQKNDYYLMLLRQKLAYFFGQLLMSDVGQGLVELGCKTVGLGFIKWIHVHG